MLGWVSHTQGRPFGRLERIDLPGGAPGPGWAWWCPGCQSHHAVDGRWAVMDPDGAAPSIVPSVVVRDGNGLVLCHSIVRDGVLDYLTDSAHPWAGASVRMEPFEPQGEVSADF